MHRKSEFCMRVMPDVNAEGVNGMRILIGQFPSNHFSMFNIKT